MEKEYDIIIIGTGTAGRTLAGRAESSGMKFTYPTICSDIRYML